MQDRRLPRWLPVSWLILAALAIVVPLVAGTGVSGFAALLVVGIVTALLLTLVWGILRVWPRGRFRILNFLRVVIALLVVGLSVVVYACGGLAVVRFFGDGEELPLQDRFVCVVVCDGANLKQARDLLMAGLEDDSLYSTTVSTNFPTISEHFIRNGAFTANGLAVWPSSSVPAHTGIMTGCYPRNTNVMGQRQFNPERKLHTSYIGLGITMLSKVLSRQVNTLCEHFPKVRSLVVLQIANRGASLYVPTMPHDEEVVKWSCQVIRATEFLGRYSGRCEIPRIVVMTLPDIDHQTHNTPLNDDRSRAIYLAQDKHLANILQTYRDVGIFDRTLFVLCSDHGMEDVGNHLTIDNLMHDLRFDVYQSLKWALVPQWGSFEANFWVGRKALFDGSINGVSLWGGNSDALIYVRGQQRDDTGAIVSESWNIRPTDEDLRAYEVGGTSVDVIGRLLDYSPGIGIIFTNPEPHLFNIYSAVGHGQLRERQEAGSIEFSYSVVSGDDPLGYAAIPRIAPFIETAEWLTDQHWAELTYLEHYPDALRRIAYSFENPNSGHMHITATDGWDFAPYYVAKNVLSGSHGSLNEHASLVPIMFHGPGVRTVELPYARTVDIVPTILRYFGLDPTGLDGRPLPIFEDDDANAAIRADAASVFTEHSVTDGDWLYGLEHCYASYDRKLVREHLVSGEREVLVPSVREALPDLQAQPNLTLELVDISEGMLVLRKMYPDEDRTGDTVRWDVQTRAFR